MQPVKLDGLRIGMGALTPHVRSVIESFLYLLRGRLDRSAASADTVVEVEFFDRLADLQSHARSGRKAASIYLRGFEPFARAELADAVIDRPIRPTVLEATLNRIRQRSQSSAAVAVTPKAEALTYSADQMLQWLQQSGSAGAAHIRCGTADWWCSPALSEVCGTALETARKLIDSGPVCFAVEAAAAYAPPPTAKALPFDQWVFLLARQTSGAQLLGHDELSTFSITRSVLSATENREFARLSALFLRPHSVQQAALLARTSAETVRQFLNANIVLGRASLAQRAAEVRSSVPPVVAQADVPPAAAASTQTGNLFSRLFRRLVAGSTHVR